MQVAGEPLGRRAVGGAARPRAQPAEEVAQQLVVAEVGLGAAEAVARPRAGVGEGDLAARLALAGGEDAARALVAGRLRVVEDAVERAEERVEDAQVRVERVQEVVRAGRRARPHADRRAVGEGPERATRELEV